MMKLSRATFEIALGASVPAVGEENGPPSHQWRERALVPADPEVEAAR